MSDSSWITETDHGGIRHMVLNASPVNALRADGLMGFADLICAAEADKTIRAIVISSGCKVFSAGLDLKAASEFNQDEQRQIVDGLNHAFLQLFACPKPVITAVNGAALAGGLFFVLAADHRVASPRASFGLAEVRVGVDFPVGPMEIARATLSPNDLRRLMLSGQPIGVEAAQDAGIVDRIVPQEGLISAALQDAATFAAIPPGAYASVKRQIRNETIQNIHTQMQVTRKEWFLPETRIAMRAMIKGKS